MNDFGTTHGAQLARFFGATLIAVLASMPTFMLLFMIGAGIDSLFSTNHHPDFSGLNDFLMSIGPALLLSFLGVVIFPFQVLFTFVLTLVGGAIAAGWPTPIFRIKKKSHWFFLGSTIGLAVGTTMLSAEPLGSPAAKVDLPILLISFATGGVCMHLWRAILEYWLRNLGYGAYDEKWWIDAG